MTAKITDRMTGWMESRHALRGVFGASFAETTVIPIPIEVVLIPVMLTNRARLWRIALSALAGCLVGATIGYFIGFAAYEAVAQPLVESAGWAEQVDEYRQKLEQDGFWYVLLVAVTPVPFQVGYLGAGLAGMPFPSFIAAAAVGRGVRYFGLAVLVMVLGRAAGPWLERNRYQIAIWATLLFIGGYAAYQLFLG